MNTIVTILLIIITMAVVVFATPRYIPKPPIFRKPVKNAICLPLGKPCMNSNLPCCTLTYENNYMGYDLVQTTCFKFGKGVCQVNQSIENFDEYSRLIKFLNNTNFSKLKSMYWNSVSVAYSTSSQKITTSIRVITILLLIILIVH